MFYCDLLCSVFHYNTSPICLQHLLKIFSLINFLVSQVLNLESAIDFSLSTKYLISFYILQFSLHRLAHICPFLSTVIAQLSYYNSLLKSLPDFDLFPFWEDRAYCEIELQSPEDDVPLPDWLTVIREVTDDPRYTNSALALEIPMDPI